MLVWIGSRLVTLSLSKGDGQRQGASFDVLTMLIHESSGY